MADEWTVEPMLASAMTRGQRLEDYATGDWVMETKYDGHRVLVRKAGTTVATRSRLGNGRDLPPQIRQAVAALPDGLYDGELLFPGGRSNDVTRLDVQDRLVLVLFDIVEVLGQRVTGLAYRERRQLLALAVEHVGASAFLRLAEQLPVSRAAVEAVWAAGGEGGILKRQAARYQPGYRSPDWVKVKKEVVVTVTCIGFQTGDTGIPFGKTCVRDAAGREFSVKTLNQATMRAVAADPTAFVGRRLVVKCNDVFESGALRHPMFDHWAGEGE